MAEFAIRFTDAVYSHIMFNQTEIEYARTKLAEIAAAHSALFRDGYRCADGPDGGPLTEVDPTEFLRAVAFLKHVEPIKTPNRNRTSWGYKHVAERWWRK